MPRIGTLTLVGPPLEFLPSHRSDRFPGSVQKPGAGSRHLYTGGHLGSKQVSPKLSPEPYKEAQFRPHLYLFDASSVVRCCSSPQPTPAMILCHDFSLTLTTLTLNQSSLRWFEACSCKPAQRGLPSSLAQLRTPLIWKQKCALLAH